MKLLLVIAIIKGEMKPLFMTHITKHKLEIIVLDYDFEVENRDNLLVYEDENETFCSWIRIIADDIQLIPYELLKKIHEIFHL
jgi:hypothetical protein